MAFEQRSEESEKVSHVDIWENMVPGKRNSHSKGPERIGKEIGVGGAE